MLLPTLNPYVRIVCSNAPCVADALRVRSAERVTLQPLDGIALRHAQNHAIHLPLVMKGSTLLASNFVADLAPAQHHPR